MRHRVPALIALLGVLPAISALAGPREDTLAGISRCANIRDDRNYLDCIYGATQPLRGSLGLPPALPAQQRLVPPAQSATQIAPSSPTVAPVTRTASQNGGLLGRIFGTGAPELRMSTYTFDKRGLFTAVLSNGEVWQQDSNDTSYAHFGGRASDYVVSLTTTEFGGTKMDVRGEPGSFTVRRVR